MWRREHNVTPGAFDDPMNGLIAVLPNKESVVLMAKKRQDSY